MDLLIPLCVVVPLSAAVLVSVANVFFGGHRRALDACSIAAAASVVVMSAATTLRVAHGTEVYWFGGFRPSNGIALGIDFAVGELNSGLATLAACLVAAAMVFSWRYFEPASTWYHALMLVFLAGMVGFCLTGDLFDLFVWFELMGVAAYALTAYRPEEKGPIQGSLNFAVTNSVGAYLSLSGIGLLYARTGALNMAQIGRVISSDRPDGLVVVAFVLVLTGLLAKSAIAPFHFWLADAHAVAPTPVCVLFSGVMVELGLYGIARVYWSIFGDTLRDRGTMSAAFLALGTLTALVGAVFCFRQRHVKRLLAFSTVAHAGIFLIGLSLLTPLGLAADAEYILGHGLVKAALFLCIGIVLHRLGSVNETWLHGRGRQLKVTGALFLLAALGLSDLPPFGTWLGASWLGSSAASTGVSWANVVVIGTTVVTGAAVLRVGFGVFYGLGDPPAEDPDMALESDEETSETLAGKGRTPAAMLIPALSLVAAALAVGLWPHVGSGLEHGAEVFANQTAYSDSVLGRAPQHQIPLPATEPTTLGLSPLLVSIATTAGALLLALSALYRRRIPMLSKYRPSDMVRRIAQGLQSGVISDYVTWQVLGIACLGGALAFSIR